MPWEFDRGHSYIGFSAKHIGINFIHGSFEDADVTVDLSSDNPVDWSLKAVIKAASLNSGIARRDDALRGELYLAAEQYPTIEFESKRVERRGDNRFAVVGPLTIRGVTRDVELDVTYGGEQVDRDILHRGFSATASIDRFDFGIGDRNDRAKTWTVGDNINFILELDAALR
jgi:polyisoprenoid-binding protein YceI